MPPQMQMHVLLMLVIDLLFYFSKSENIAYMYIYEIKSYMYTYEISYIYTYENTATY